MHRATFLFAVVVSAALVNSALAQRGGCSPGGTASMNGMTGGMGGGTGTAARGSFLPMTSTAYLPMMGGSMASMNMPYAPQPYQPMPSLEIQRAYMQQQQAAYQQYQQESVRVTQEEAAQQRKRDLAKERREAELEKQAASRAKTLELKNAAKSMSDAGK